MSSIQRSVTTLLVIAGLSACGGGGGDSSGGGSSPPATNADPGGIWTVKYVVASGPNAGATIQGKALVTEPAGLSPGPGGEAFFAEINTANGCAVVGFGQVNVLGSSVSGSTNDAVVTFSQSPSITTSCSFADGSKSASSTLTGTVTARSSFALTETTTTTLGMALGSESNTWSYSSVYGENITLASIAGNYADGAYTLTVSSDGTITEQQPDTGCMISGQVTQHDPFHNAWAVSLTFASCTGSLAVLNGQTSIGFGYYDDSVTPNQFVYGVHVTLNGQTAVQAGALTKD